jgi:UrcA family protein
MEMVMKQILNTMTLAALVGLAALTNSALAGEQQVPHAIADEKAVVLHFGDLNPAVPADASELLARLRLVARNACIRNDEWRQIFLADGRKACIDASYARAVAGINAKRNVDLEAVAARHPAHSEIASTAR